MKKRLLIATDGFLPRWDGISSFLNEIIPRIQDYYDITVIAPDRGTIKQKYKAEIIKFNTFKIRLGDNYFPSIVNPFVMDREIKKADIVWVQALGPIGIWGIILGKLKKKPVVIYNHMLEWEVFPKSQGLNLLKVPINMVVKLMGRIFYNLCKVVMVSSIEHTELLTLMGIRNVKKVVHLGVDVEHYKPPRSKKKAKKKVGIGPEKFVVGYGGRVSYEKNLRTLYRAYLRFRKKHKNTILLIAGGGRPEIEKLFSGKKDVILTGLKDDLAPYYRAMDVYVLPSLVETTSLTTMEAMASGCAVISTPVGFVKEYINDGQNGLFFSKKSSYELFRKIDYLKNDPSAVRELGRNARKSMLRKYTWEKTAKSIKEVLDGIQ